MLTQSQAREILQVLQMLPSDKLAEVYDYITFLRERYVPEQSVDVSEAWSDTDIIDLVAASFAHSERAVPTGAE